MYNDQNMRVVIDIAEILLNRIESSEKPDDFLITYGELAQLLPYEINPRNLDNPLGTLSNICKDLDLPLISTIVVNKDTFMPGAGYFIYFFPGIKEPQRVEIFLEQFNKVVECSDWASLAEHFWLA